ncbi:tyrosine-protein phosphatase [Humidisolicoccus flavus]|uniref:tyrosine-protein phosphatase n=1 Tax=Humidisolicoccus flavus TaxID=3111414 RepID=UPI00324F8D3D
MRELHWDGYPNNCDLGGLPTEMSSTGMTRFGRLARGPRRERLTTSGWAAAREWGVRSIVDLRTAAEVGSRNGDPTVGEADLRDISVVLAPTENQEDPEFQRLCFPILDSPEYWQHNWVLQPELVAAALRAIAGAVPGILFHCSAGRDRTGMISALLLGNAGVDPAAVFEDYAESVLAMAGANVHSPTHDRQSAWSREEALEWLESKRDIVEDAARRAPEILEQLGLTAGERARLRTLLVSEDATS